MTYLRPSGAYLGLYADPDNLQNLWRVFMRLVAKNNGLLFNFYVVDKCLKIQNKDAEEVFTMRQEYLDYGTCLYLQLPTNMTTTARRMSCVVNNTISVNGLTSKEKLLTVHPFKINTNIRDNRICLQVRKYNLL